MKLTQKTLRQIGRSLYTQPRGTYVRVTTDGIVHFDMSPMTSADTVYCLLVREVDRPYTVLEVRDMLDTVDSARVFSAGTSGRMDCRESLE